MTDDLYCIDTRHLVTINEIVARSVKLALATDEIDTFFVLEQELERVTGDLDQARAEKSRRKQIAQLENERLELVRLIETAIRVHIEAQTELESARHGEKGELLFVFDAEKGSVPRVTKHSAYNWLSSKFGIEIQDWAPATKRQAVALSDVKDNTTRPLREDKENSYLRVVEGLVSLLIHAGQGNKFVKSDETANASAISDEIIEALTPHPRNEPIPKKPTIQKILKASGVANLTRQSRK